MAGISLLPASRPQMIGYQRALWHLVRLGGPRLLPGRRTQWTPPIEREQWSSLENEWRRRIGPFDTCAIYERPQPSRVGIGVMLLAEGDPVAFVKMRKDPAPLVREGQILEAFERTPPKTFRTPRALDSGDIGEWYWLASSALTPCPNRHARRLDLEPVVAEIQTTLADVLTRDESLPAEWRPMHGDVVPWNLRVTPDRSVWVLDWEDASWAPPAADIVYAAATWAVVFRQRVVPAPAEAVDFWTERIRSRGVDDRLFNRSLLHVLEKTPRTQPEVTGRRTGDKTERWWR